MTTFNNHAPINFTNAETIAKAEADLDFGVNSFHILKGNQYHLYNRWRSAYDNGGSGREYIFGCRALEEMIAFLVEKTRNDEAQWWANKLLEELNYDGEDA